MADLKTNYKDDVLVSGQWRKYNMIQNSDGTVSFVDVSSYAQYGDTLKAEDFNATNAAVNALNGKTEEIESKMIYFDGSNKSTFFNSGRKYAGIFYCWTSCEWIPQLYGSGIILPCLDASKGQVIYVAPGAMYFGEISYLSQSVTWKTVATT